MIKQGPTSDQPRPPYDAPELIVHGSLEDITEALKDPSGTPVGSSLPATG